MTTTQTILAALQATSLPIEAQACLAAIAEGQGTLDFATLWSGGTLINSADSANIKIVDGLREWTGSLATFPTWSGATTISPAGDFSTAAGAWQDTRTTFLANASTFGITDFEPASQISFNWQLAVKNFGVHMGANLLQFLQAGEIAMAWQYLVGTWPAGPGFDFATSYAANLAALRAPAPQPQPTPPPAPTPEQLTLTIANNAFQATDASGQSWPLILKIGGIALAAVMTTIMAGKAEAPTVLYPSGPFAPPSVSDIVR